MKQAYCLDCQVEISDSSRTGRCKSCAAKAYRKREREAQGLPDPPACTDCGKPISHSNQGGRCRSCTAKQTRARMRTEREHIATETGEPVSIREWYNVWEASSNNQKPHSTDSRLCSSCGKRIGKKGQRGLCTSCAGKLSAKQNKVKAQARGYAKRVIAGEKLVFRFIDRGAK